MSNQPNYQRMFEAACVALGEVGDALGCDPNEGGTEPILDAIQSLIAERDVFRVTVGYESPLKALEACWEGSSLDDAPAAAQQPPNGACDSPKLCKLNGECAGKYGTKQKCIAAPQPPQADALAADHAEDVRYCYECGSIGEVPNGKRDCCPDGSHAKYVHREIAEQAKGGFHSAPAPDHVEDVRRMVPMTPEQISDAYQKATGQTLRPCDKHAVESMTREIEAHHEIGVKP